MRVRNYPSAIAVALAAALALPVLTGATADEAARDIPRLIISTDVATGLIDTHGGMSLTPVSFDADHAYSTDSNVAPQDIDDGLTLAMALNLDAAGLAEVLAVVPTYGNATLPAEMLVARKIVRKLKGRKDIPVVPGAIGPAAHILNPTATWFDGRTVPITGASGSFAQACDNSGVALMRRKLNQANGFGRSGKVTILAIGPLTDVACLLETASKKTLKNIAEIVILASRVKGESLTVNGKVVNDFNFRMDPVAGTILLVSAGKNSVPVRLMSFSLSGVTSQKATLFGFDRATYPGRRPATRASRKSYRWLIKASKPRQDYWKGIFGTIEGPFDQYTLAAALKPDLFDCADGLAQVDMCPYPAWSPDYPTDSNGDPTEEPFNAPGNRCTDHGTANGASLSEVPAELVVTEGTGHAGALVRGTTGVDGNIPKFKGTAAQPVTVCTGFAGSKGRSGFESFLKTWTW